MSGHMSELTLSPSTAPVTGRAILFGLLGGIQAVIIQVATKVQPGLVIPPWTSAPYLSWYAILPGAVFYLFVLAVLNSALKRWLPRYAFRPAEFAVIYGLTTVGAAIGSMEQGMLLLPTYVYPFRESLTDGMGEFRQFIPHWFVPQTREVVEPYYSGETNFWTPRYLIAWAVPLVVWTLYLAALGAAMWAWNILFRRRWLEHDRLAMPNVQVPLALCESAGFGGIMSGRMFWGGVLFAVSVETYLCLQPFVPALPVLPMFISLNPLVETMRRPWDGLFPLEMAASTLHFGVCYFIPTEILFSGWFFFALRKGMDVWGRGMGWREVGWDPEGFPHPRALAVGAWVTVFLFLVWAERRRIAEALKWAFASQGEWETYRRSISDEYASYRSAGRVLIASTLFLIGFSVLAGMSPFVAIIFYAFYWMVQITLTRIYCQVGPPILEVFFLDAPKAITSILGTREMENSTITHLALMSWLTRTHSGNPMAHQMVAFHIADQTGVQRKRFGGWILCAFIIGAMTCLFAYLHFAYGVGEDMWREGGWKECDVQTSVSRINEWSEMPKGPLWDKVLFMALGAGITGVLWKATYSVVGFPFHPLGFALAMSHGVEFTWLAFFTVWIGKALILRWGGLRLYRQGIPLFLGITLGGLIATPFWGLVAWIVGWHKA
jgi:hypothetical protein